MSGGGWWFDGTGARDVWMNLSPPPQTTVSALENTEHLQLDRKQRTLLAHTDASIYIYLLYSSLNHLTISIQNPKNKT